MVYKVTIPAQLEESSDNDLTLKIQRSKEIYTNADSIEEALEKAKVFLIDPMAKIKAIEYLNDAMILQ